MFIDIGHVYEQDARQLNSELGIGMETPLFVACKHNRIKSVQYLLKHSNIDVNILNCGDKSSTPLIEACMGEFYQIIKLLLFRNDITLKTIHHSTFHSPRSALLCALIFNSNPNSNNNCDNDDKTTIVRTSTNSNDIKKTEQDELRMKKLVASKDHRNIDIDKGFNLATLFIRKYGCSINQRYTCDNYQYVSLLQLAIDEYNQFKHKIEHEHTNPYRYQGHINYFFNVIKYLLHDCGDIIDPNRSLEHGQTPLYFACKENLPKIVKLILQCDTQFKKNIIIDTRATFTGYTPLMISAEYGHIQCLKLLLDYGKFSIAFEDYSDLNVLQSMYLYFVWYNLYIKFISFIYKCV